MSAECLSNTQCFTNLVIYLVVHLLPLPDSELPGRAEIVPYLSSGPSEFSRVFDSESDLGEGPLLIEKKISEEQAHLRTVTSEA